MNAERARTRDAQARAESATTPEPVGDAPLLPPTASPGQCFARVYVPPTYEVITEEILKKQESQKIITTPPVYEWAEETILVKEASKKLVPVPAQYEWVEESILVREAYKTWKKGRGLIEKVDNTTGEIMCLVEVPAQYKVVKKRVMVSQATTKEIEIPAIYRTIKVRKLVSEAQTQVIPIPAEYQTVTRKRMVTPGHLEWRQVMCETNTTSGFVVRLQRALDGAGHDPGPIDGVIGWRTMNAVKAYQKEKGLAVGQLTYETVRSLGIQI